MRKYPICQRARQDIERLSRVDHHGVRVVRGSEWQLWRGWPSHRGRNDIAVFGERLKLICGKEAELRRGIKCVRDTSSGLYRLGGDTCGRGLRLARNGCWRALIAEPRGNLSARL